LFNIYIFISDFSVNRHLIYASNLIVHLAILIVTLSHILYYTLPVINIFFKIDIAYSSSSNIYFFTSIEIF